MKPPKLKAAAQAVPQTREEADRLLGEIGALKRDMERIDQTLTDDIAILKERARVLAEPLGAALENKWKALTSWAEAHKDELLEGKRRSVMLSHGELGWRLGNPTVQVKRGEDDAVINTLKRLGLGRFVRNREELDKAAILRDVPAVDGIPGLSVVQVEAIFVKPLDVKVEVASTSRKLTGQAVSQPDAA